MGSAAVDIVISTYGRGDRIDATIAGIRQSRQPNFTLWVLDQSADNSTERCVMRHSALDSRVRYFRVPLRGISGTRNSGAALGDAPFILFTNDDCLITPGWIDGLLAELADEQTWLAFGQVLPGVKDQRGNSDVVLALQTSARRRVYRGYALDLGFGQGHNMGARREHFDALGGFDELLGSGGPLGAWDELDIGYRALRRGGQIVYTPSALVYHCHWQSWRSARRSYRNYGIGAGAAVAKYVRCGDPWAVLLLLEWIFSQGLRQVLSGLLKWRRWGKVLLGLSQFVYPWVGIMRGLRYRYDRRRCLYCAQRAAEAEVAASRSYQ
jgi:GT2 family glycosyltransferase